MGESSDAEGGGGMGVVDCGVGTIVWVRRRNGSWWPGKILGPQQLSSSHLMSPRSGTPVKLLGREDASVDWYNLEKSKRVKPFRCGEFDDCIERAEASQGMPPKKREKYARREDAILHALHLEKQLLNPPPPSPSQNNNNPPHSTATIHHHPPPHQLQIINNDNNVLHHNDDDNDDDDDDDDDDVTTPPTTFTHLPTPTPTPFKNKLSSSSTPQSTIPIPVTTTTTTNTTSLHNKRKRSQEEEEDDEDDDEDEDETSMINNKRRHLLLNNNSSRLQGDDGSVVWEEPPVANDDDDHHHPPMAMGGVTSAAAHSFDYVHVGLLSEDNTTTGSNEDTETDSSGTESLLSDTYMAAAAALSGDEGEHIEFIPKAFRRSEVAGGESMSDDDDSGLPNDSGDSLATVSKWQLKGKRNSRRYPERKNHWISNNNFKEEEDTSCDYYFDKNLGMGHNNNNNNNRPIISWGEDMTTTPLQGYWEQYHHDSSSSVYFRMNSMLIDVDLQVQSSYQREHVPMISLMSKLNDKAIVGHPIPIETLEDGSSDIILSAAVEEFQMETLQPWRTARMRTAKCRVPRPPTLDEEEEEEEEEEAEYYVDDESLNRKGMSRKPLKKSQRKTNLSSYNQKIRTLSSIDGTQQQQQHSIIMDSKTECFVVGKKGLMKRDSLLPTAVACIPVKLVFSRLHEELVARHQ